MIPSNLNLEAILSFERLKRLFACLFLVAALLLSNPLTAESTLQFNTGENGNSVERSLESLRDVDYQTWQLVAYPRNSSKGSFVLRIVGYPGTLRMDHPTALNVYAGLKEWNLQDITLSNDQLANDPREAAAEFDLAPLLNDLSKNRPLRLMLPDVFSDLPIPPYVVDEWRSLAVKELMDDQG